CLSVVLWVAPSWLFPLCLVQFDKSNPNVFSVAIEVSDYHAGVGIFAASTSVVNLDGFKWLGGASISCGFASDHRRSRRYLTTLLERPREGWGESTGRPAHRIQHNLWQQTFDWQPSPADTERQADPT